MTTAWPRLPADLERLHFVAGFANVQFRKLGPRGDLPARDLER